MLKCACLKFTNLNFREASKQESATTPKIPPPSSSHLLWRTHTCSAMPGTFCEQGHIRSSQEVFGSQPPFSPPGLICSFSLIRLLHSARRPQHGQIKTSLSAVINWSKTAGAALERPPTLNMYSNTFIFLNVILKKAYMYCTRKSFHKNPSSHGHCIIWKANLPSMPVSY